MPSFIQLDPAAVSPLTKIKTNNFKSLFLGRLLQYFEVPEAENLSCIYVNQVVLDLARLNMVIVVALCNYFQYFIVSTQTKAFLTLYITER